MNNIFFIEYLNPIPKFHLLFPTFPKKERKETLFISTARQPEQRRPCLKFKRFLQRIKLHYRVFVTKSFESRRWPRIPRRCRSRQRTALLPRTSDPEVCLVLSCSLSYSGVVSHVAMLHTGVTDRRHDGSQEIYSYIAPQHRLQTDRVGAPPRSKDQGSQ